jgi:hypothetical protein
MYIISNKKTFFIFWILSLIILIYSYLQLINFKIEDQLEFALKQNKTFYNLNFIDSENQNDNTICFATIEAGFIKQSELESLKIKGLTKIRLKNQSALEFRFAGELGFNAFNQVGALNFSLKKDNLLFQINGKNINPIRIKLSVSDLNKEIYIDNFELPGPIELITNGSKYRLRLPNLKRASMSKKLQIDQMLNLGKFQVEVSDQTCKISELEIDQNFINQLKSYATNSL